MPYRTYPSRRGPATSSRLPKAEAFPDSFPACMQDTWGWLPSQVYSFPTAWKSLICIHANDHITWNNKSFEMRWCYKRVNKHTKNIMPGFIMLAFKVWRSGGALQNFWKLSASLQNPILKILELTHNFKTAQKRCLKNFQINLKIN